MPIAILTSNSKNNLYVNILALLGTLSLDMEPEQPVKGTIIIDVLQMKLNIRVTFTVTASNKTTSTLYTLDGQEVFFQI